MFAIRILLRRFSAIYLAICRPRSICFPFDFESFAESFGLICYFSVSCSIIQTFLKIITNLNCGLDTVINKLDTIIRLNTYFYKPIDLEQQVYLAFHSSARPNQSFGRNIGRYFGRYIGSVSVRF